jgi:NAD(P)-dependent dehydrogenase (short-subunit alcohol dehydrogenase family)
MDTHYDLRGKVALVTGAARGLGKAFSQTLSGAGASLVCADVDESSLEETVRMLRSQGREALPVVADVSLSPEARRMVSETLSGLGRIDIAINNAGIITRPSRFHEITLEEWGKVISTDLTGVFLCMQEELAVMVNQQSGVIINVTSVAGLRGVAPEHRPRANYVAAKHGIVGLTKQAALEYALDNIRVNAIAPGWFEGTDLGRARMMAEGEKDPSLERKRNAFVPMGRKGNLDELKGLILFLASDASSYITGQVFAVDGGITAR